MQYNIIYVVKCANSYRFFRPCACGTRLVCRWRSRPPLWPLFPVSSLICRWKRRRRFGHCPRPSPFDRWRKSRQCRLPNARPVASLVRDLRWYAADESLQKPPLSTINTSKGRTPSLIYIYYVIIISREVVRRKVDSNCVRKRELK